MMSADAPAIRLETYSDISAIRSVLRAAFAGDAEAELVERLRSDGQLVLVLVAETAIAGVIGCIAFALLAIEAENFAERAVALAPLAVAPEHQRRGVGSALVNQALAALKLRGERLVFVLGDTCYYGRFGFRPEIAARFGSAYAGEHFMALRLAQGGSETGYVRYPAAFDALT
jgi:putative acetyltransferase